MMKKMGGQKSRWNVPLRQWYLVGRFTRYTAFQQQKCQELWHPGRKQFKKTTSQFLDRVLSVPYLHSSAGWQVQNSYRSKIVAYHIWVFHGAAGVNDLNVMWDLNLNSFSILFCRSAVGVVKMAAPFNGLPKTKPKKWVNPFTPMCWFLTLSLNCV